MNQEFDNFKSIETDACNMKDIFEALDEELQGAPFKGIIFSNELIDALPVQKVRIHPDGRAEVSLIIPRAELAFVRDALLLSEDEEKQLLETSQQIAGIVSHQIYEDAVYLSQEILLRLVSKVWQEEESNRNLWWWPPNSYLDFSERYVDASYFPDVMEYLKRYREEIAEGLRSQVGPFEIYVYNHAEQYIQAAAKILNRNRRNAGFVVTIDYGGTWQYFRDHPEVFIPIVKFDFPGNTDKTVLVNFDVLIAAGRRAGLEVIHYGPQGDLVNDDIRRIARSWFQDRPLEDFARAETFRLLIQKQAGRSALKPLRWFSSAVRRPSLLTVAGSMAGLAGVAAYLFVLLRKAFSQMMRAKFYCGIGLNLLAQILCRILFLGAIVPHEFGHWLAGPWIGKRKEYGVGLKHFVTAMPWRIFPGDKASWGWIANLITGAVFMWSPYFIALIVTSTPIPDTMPLEYGRIMLGILGYFWFSNWFAALVDMLPEKGDLRRSGKQFKIGVGQKITGNPIIVERVEQLEDTLIAEAKKLVPPAWNTSLRQVD